MNKEVTFDELDILIQEIFDRFQYDFRLYARSSLRRRLEQALIKFHCTNLTELRRKLEGEANFFPQLLAYLTVNTTEFFRDPGYFKAFKEKVIPVLKTFPSVKIWIAGCSTGEEVLSISILLSESGIKRYLIYATDINPMNLEKAERAIYEAETVRKASGHYYESGGSASFSDYYESAYQSVQFDPKLLKNVVFSDHSLATDSVFSEMHFISCRNVLIYFDKPLQDKVLNLFNDSLVNQGFLGLGTKESLQFSTLKNKFQVIDSEFKIYQK